MYAALFEISGFMGLQQYIFEGGNPCSLLAQFEEVQDLSCLVRMGRMNEGKRGQKALDQLEELLDRYYAGELTMEELQKVEIKISIGAFRCVKVVEGDEAIAALRAEYPDAYDR